MKKRLSAILSALLVFCSLSFAYADEFTLHNGTKFGMTMEEVSSIEKEKGYEVEETTARYIFVNKEDGETYSGPAPVLKISGSMAGVPDSTLYYYFEDDKLFAVLYEFQNRDEEHNGIYTSLTYSDYDEIQSSLEKKYTGEWSYTGTTGMSELPLFLSEKKVGTYKGSVARIASTEYPIDEKGTVYINHAIMYTSVDGSSEELCVIVSGSHYLEYRYESLESQKESDEAIADKESREQEEELQRQQKQEAERDNDL